MLNQMKGTSLEEIRVVNVYPDVDKDWYPGYHPVWTWMAQGGSDKTRPIIQKILEDHSVLLKT
jgi:hypothetical protein